MTSAYRLLHLLTHSERSHDKLYRNFTLIEDTELLINEALAAGRFSVISNLLAERVVLPVAKLGDWPRFMRYMVIVMRLHGMAETTAREDVMTALGRGDQPSRALALIDQLVDPQKRMRCLAWLAANEALREIASARVIELMGEDGPAPDLETLLLLAARMGGWLGPVWERWLEDRPASERDAVFAVLASDEASSRADPDHPVTCLARISDPTVLFAYPDSFERLARDPEAFTTSIQRKQIASDQKQALLIHLLGILLAREADGQPIWDALRSLGPPRLSGEIVARGRDRWYAWPYTWLSTLAGHTEDSVAELSLWVAARPDHMRIPVLLSEISDPLEVIGIHLDWIEACFPPGDEEAVRRLRILAETLYQRDYDIGADDLAHFFSSLQGNLPEMGPICFHEMLRAPVTDGHRLVALARASRDAPVSRLLLAEIEAASLIVSRNPAEARRFSVHLWLALVPDLVCLENATTALDEALARLPRGEHDRLRSASAHAALDAGLIEIATSITADIGLESEKRLLETLLDKDAGKGLDLTELFTVGLDLQPLRDEVAALVPLLGPDRNPDKVLGEYLPEIADERLAARSMVDLALVHLQSERAHTVPARRDLPGAIRFFRPDFAALGNEHAMAELAPDLLSLAFALGEGNPIVDIEVTVEMLFSLREIEPDDRREVMVDLIHQVFEHLVEAPVAERGRWIDALEALVRLPGRMADSEVTHALRREWYRFLPELIALCALVGAAGPDARAFWMDERARGVISGSRERLASGDRNARPLDRTSLMRATLDHEDAEFLLNGLLVDARDDELSFQLARILWKKAHLRRRVLADLRPGIPEGMTPRNVVLLEILAHDSDALLGSLPALRCLRLEADALLPILGAAPLDILNRAGVRGGTAVTRLVLNALLTRFEARQLEHTVDKALGVGLPREPDPPAPREKVGRDAWKKKRGLGFFGATWQHGTLGSFALLANLGLGFALTAIDTALWDGSFLFLEFTRRMGNLSPYPLMIMLLLASLASGAVLGRFLHTKTPRSLRFRPWLYGLRNLLCFLPFCRFLAIVWWRVLIRDQPTWAVDSGSLSSDPNRPPRAANVLGRSFDQWLSNHAYAIQISLFIANIVTIWAVLLWLLAPSPLPSSRVPVVAGLSVVLHLLSLVHIRLFFRFWQGSAGRLTRGRLLLRSASWLTLIPLPILPIVWGALLFFEPFRRSERSMLRQIYDKRSSPEVPSLQRGPHERWAGGARALYGRALFRIKLCFLALEAMLLGVVAAPFFGGRPADVMVPLSVVAGLYLLFAILFSWKTSVKPERRREALINRWVFGVDILSVLFFSTVGFGFGYLLRAGFGYEAVVSMIWVSVGLPPLIWIFSTVFFLILNKSASGPTEVLPWFALSFLFCLFMVGLIAFSAVANTVLLRFFTFVAFVLVADVAFSLYLLPWLAGGSARRAWLTEKRREAWAGKPLDHRWLALVPLGGLAIPWLRWFHSARINHWPEPEGSPEKARSWRSEALEWRADSTGIAIAMVAVILLFPFDLIVWAVISGETSLEVPLVLVQPVHWVPYLCFGLVQGLCLDSFLMRVNTGEACFPKRLRIMRFLFASVPLFGFLVVAWWRRAATRADEAGAPPGRVPLFRLRRSLGETMIGSYPFALLYVLVFFLSFSLHFNRVIVSLEALSMVTLLGVTIALHLTAAGVMVLSMVLQAREGHVSPSLRVAMIVIGMFWLLPVPLAGFIGLILYLYLEPGRSIDRSLIRQVNARRSAVPAVLRGAEVRDQVPLAIESEIGRQRRHLIAIKATTLVFETAATTWLGLYLLSLAAPGAFLPAVEIIEHVVLFGALLALPGFLTQYRAYRRIRAGDRRVWPEMLRMGRWFGLLPLILCLGLALGASLADGNATHLAMAVLLVALPLGIGGVLVIIVTEPLDAQQVNRVDRAKWMIPIIILALASKTLATDPEYAALVLTMLGMSTLVAPVTGIVQGRIRALCLIHPHETEFTNGVPLPDEQKRAADILVRSACLPFGGLLIPYWIYAIRRYFLPENRVDTGLGG